MKVNLELNKKVNDLINEVQKVIVGQYNVILKTILALLVDGNVLFGRSSRVS